MTTKIYPNVSPSLNPATVAHIDGYDNCADLCSGAIRAFEFASDFLQRTHQARIDLKGNPLVSPDEAIIKLDDISGKNFSKSHSMFYECRQSTEALIKTYQSELTKPMVQQANADLVNTEIRAHFKFLKPEDRREQLMAAINSIDTKTASAILGAPPYLSGLTQAETDAYTLSYHQKSNPAIYGKLRTMKKVLEIVEHRHGLLQTEFNKAIGAEPAKVNYLREQQSKASAAFKSAQ